MKQWKNQYTLKILVGLFALFMVGCPNNLVDKIEEGVEVVVTPPSIVSIYPEAGAVSIPVDMDDVLITFTKQIDDASVNGSSFITKDSEGNTITGSYSVSNDTVSFNPSSNLSYNTEFTISVNSAIFDVDGNSLSTDFSWTFTTEDAPVGIKPVINYVRINGGKSATNNTIVTLDISAADISGNTQGLRAHYRIVGDPDWTDWADLADGILSVSNIDLNVSQSGSVVIFEAEVKDSAGVPSYLAQSQIIYELLPPSVVDVNWDDNSVFPYNGSVLRIIFDDEMNYSSFTDLTYFVERVSDSALITGMIDLAEVNSIYNSSVNLSDLSLDPNTQYQVTLYTTVEDIAGNEMGGEENTVVWTFDTGDSTDTTAPDGSISLISFDPDGAGGDPPSFVAPYANGVIATNSYQVRMDLSDITDDYNDVVGMKFWGDTEGGYTFEPDDNDWLNFASFQDWNVSNTPGTKFVLCKFLDSAGNESESVKQVKIFLDGVRPSNPSVEVNGENSGITYTNNSDRKISIDITATDDDTGIEKMMISTFSNFSDTDWVDWSSTVDEWLLPSGDADYTVYVKVRDYLENESLSPGTKSVTLDLTDPEVSFSSTNILVSEEVRLNGSYYTSSDTNGISTYFWEQVSGPGTISFDLDSGEPYHDGTGSAQPYVTGTTEGTYYIKLTVTDPVGNSSYDIVPLTWDITAPDPINGLSVTETVSGFSTTGQPTWSWNTVGNADFYRISFSNDFSNSANYEDIVTASYTPNEALVEGNACLYVRSYDYAGNHSVTVSANVFIDTVPPVIDISTYNFIEKIGSTSPLIDFYGTDGSDGPAGDIDDLDDNLLTDNASGVASIVWAMTTGPGSLSFGSPGTDKTTVTATADGNYQIRLTVTDNASNSTVAYLSLSSDVHAPDPPTLSGLATTANTFPTWNWTGTGGGNGVFYYSLYNVSDTSDVVSEWASTSALSFQYGSALPQPRTYLFTIKERDAIGNWSEEVSFTTEIDEDYTTPAEIFIHGGGSTLRNVDDIQWDVITGAGNLASNYKWYFDSGTFTEAGEGLSQDFNNPTEFTRTNLDDGVYSLTIQEYFNEEWHPLKEAVHTITIDTTPPAAPILTWNGLDTDDGDRTAEDSHYPTWEWSTGGGGGNGQFQYRLDGTGADPWTTTSGTSYAPYKSDSTYLLEVRELDDAGNASDITSHRITVDTAAPILTSVTVRRKDTYINDPTSAYTRDIEVWVDIVGNISGENADVVLKYLDYNPATAYEVYPTPFETDGHMTITTDLRDNGDGNKYVYAQLIDEAGNGSSFKSDSIILDTEAPLGTFNINDGASTTPSLSYKINLDMTDNQTEITDLLVRTRDSEDSTGHGSNYYSPYRPYSAVLDSDFQFSNTAGGRYAYLKVYDKAGNYAYMYDYITLQVPVPTYSRKGYYKTGTAIVYFDSVTEQAGDYTTRYYTYSTLDPTANPNAGDSVTYEGYTTSTSYDLVSIPKGELRYFFIRARNEDTGGYGPYSATSVLGFSSDITVIYDDGESDDILKADYIKELLEDTYHDGGILSQENMAGTMPSYTVTLLPESLIDNTVYGTENLIYGDPVIVTPGTTFIYNDDDYDIRIRNIVANGKGLVAMGYNGAELLDRVETNWSSWGLSGTAPADIGRGESGGLGSKRSTKLRAGSVSENIWHSPMNNTYLSDESTSLVNVFNSTVGDVYRYGVYLGSSPSVTDGDVYAGGDPDHNTYYPVVRQGRFVQFGYYDVPGRTSSRTYTKYEFGQVFFINIIARMDDF